MAIQFVLDTQRNVLFTRAEGLVTFEEVQKHLDEESAAALLGCQKIFDASGARTNLTADEVKRIVGRFHAMMQTGAFGPTAIITADDLFFGMARMMAILCDLQGGQRMAVFRTVDDGLSWLAGLD